MGEPAEGIESMLWMWRSSALGFMHKVSTEDIALPEQELALLSQFKPTLQFRYAAWPALHAFSRAIRFRASY